MKQLSIKAILTAIVAGLAYLFGKWDAGLQILTLFIGLDILSGIIRAVVQCELDSEVSFKGGFKKVLIYVIVAVATGVDRYLVIDIARKAVVAFYCAAEGLSIIENAAAAGLPIPEALRNILKQLNGEKFNPEA